MEHTVGRASSCLALLAALWGGGCATRPAPLPAVDPSALPQAWLEPLAGVPCPAPFRARLRMRIEAEGQPAVTVDGSLESVPSLSLRLQGRLGAFRPLFALFANADSCELLLHGPARYWPARRADTDWQRMNPAAWTQALEWTLCTADLFRILEPDGPGRVEGDAWDLTGRLRGTPHRFHLRADTRRRELREFEILDPEGATRMAARLGRSRRWRESAIPRSLEVSFPQGHLRLRADVLTVQALDPSRRAPPPMLAPPGWQMAGPEDLIPGLGAP